MRLGREQGGGGHDLAGLAVAALDDLEIEPGLLHPAAGRSFPRRLDGRDGFADGHRRDAGADRPAIEMHRAGSAQRRAAAELGAGQSDDVAQYPEQGHVRGYVHRVRLAVDPQSDHDRQASPLRRRRSLSGSCFPPAATTRSRPAPFASYSAASALAMSVSGVSPWLGHSATPMLSVMLPPANSSLATRARMRSATSAAVATVVSSSTIRNSSPPYRATQSTARVCFRRMSAIFVRAASPAGWPCVSLYCLKWSTSANSTENGRRSRRERCASLASVPIR